MSELILKQDQPESIRRQLLITASALALVGTLYGQEATAAESDDHPTVWIELGGQLERVSGSEDKFSPPFSTRMPRPDFETTSPLSFINPPRFGVGGEGKLTFEPSGTDWSFTAAVRYGRSNSKKHFHNQTTAISPSQGLFEDVKTNYKESHLILDFTVGKDVGLGLFGNASANLGVRYAQFSMASTVNLSSKPATFKEITKKVYLPTKYRNYTKTKYINHTGFHAYRASAQAVRSFHGIGPSLSFSGAVPIFRHDDDSATFDWGMNGALLFGRQRVIDQHYTYNLYHRALPPFGWVSAYNHTHSRDDRRSVIVPNIGGFAGFSMHYPNAKVSFGYRVDAFFGAMDGGLDAHKSYDRIFHGPFASISIGLGG